MRVEPFTLAPAKWIWLDAESTPPGPILLFRRAFEIEAIPEEAKGWILASSRYRLWINGRRVQWGPAPADPRHLEADPVDLRPFLQKGRNVIGIEALFVQAPEGTWPANGPGLIARLQIGDEALDTSAENWRVQPDPSHRSGLVEEFDSRAHPHGWSKPSGIEDDRWRTPIELDLDADRSPILDGDPNTTEPNDVTPRSIPLMREEIVRSSALIERTTLRWEDDAEDSFEIVRRDLKSTRTDSLKLNEEGSVLLVYELPYGVVGWPQATIDAPKGTVVELIARENHGPESSWLDPARGGRFRWISRGLEETLEPFAYESCRYLGILIRNAVPGVTIRNVGVRRRESGFPGASLLVTDDPELARVFDAGIRTIVNSAQDLIVDAMAGKRRQGSGEDAHQLHAVRTVFGGVAASRRFLTTYGEGQTSSGLWPEAWPPTERRAGLGRSRLSLDRSIGFVLDHFHHWMHSGDFTIVAEHWPRFERLLSVLRRVCETDGLLPLEGAWSESEESAFEVSAEKRCAANLYLHHMLGAACEMALVAAPASLPELQGWRDALKRKLDATFFRTELGTYVVDPAESDQGGLIRFDERALSLHLLEVEPGKASEAVALLKGDDPRVERSSPAHAVWSYWGLARHGEIGYLLADLRKRWATMVSVRENGTIGEDWETSPEAETPRSACAVAPLSFAHGALVGLRPLAPGYAEYELRPNLGDLSLLETVAHTPAGALRFRAERLDGGLRMTVTTPRYGRGRLWIGDTDQPLRPGTRESFDLHSG